MKTLKNLLQDETAAMKSIAIVFEKLPKESQQRIVNWLLSIVGTSVPPASNLQSSQANLPAVVSAIGSTYQKRGRC